MDVSLFSYKTGNSLLHRIPAGAKLIFLLFFSIGLFFVPLRVLVIGSIFLLPLFFVLTSEPRAILRDLLPVVSYSAFLCLVSVVSFSSGFEPYRIFGVLPQIIRFIVMAVAASLLYRSTSPLEMRLFLETTEISIRTFLRLKNRSPHFAGIFSLYLLFIPRIFKNWTQLEYAWKARGGKNGLQKILRLLPALFAVSLQDAYETARALYIRQF